MEKSTCLVSPQNNNLLLFLQAFIRSFLECNTHYKPNQVLMHSQIFSKAQEMI